ncbi:LysR family transcriptional regulator [Paragemmobacter ruber]|uniref:LysR family transcriptional regulator n=1 Tax=Paragemmobacter ruber TaxID=1985673 RepID=A0ABW9Y6I5_9RHOB|nr:LysR substrate-binding domain-containing protein [Rhodobacter ruber]NBE08175.1 LysR family transcriptional regulator [Rhodobacter ruber]
MHSLTPHQFIDVIARAGSIRKAAEVLAITSTALNRRVLALEEELGVPIFERLPRGVRLSTAGELLVSHLRHQASDFERLRSQLADLAGARRGHVAIACSQALLPFFLPEQIGRYRRDHPGVTFSVQLRDRAAAEAALVEHDADLALIFEPIRLSEVQILASVRQPIHAVMAIDHPLTAQATVRLRDCAAYPVAIPTTQYGVRSLIDLALVRFSVRLRVVLEADNFDFLRRYPAQEHLISFQIPIGLPDGPTADGVTSRPVDTRDIPAGRLYLCQLRGRTLPVAAAKFAAQVEGSLQDRYEF